MLWRTAPQYVLFQALDTSAETETCKNDAGVSIICTSSASCAAARQRGVASWAISPSHRPTVQKSCSVAAALALARAAVIAAWPTPAVHSWPKYFIGAEGVMAYIRLRAVRHGASPGAARLSASSSAENLSSRKYQPIPRTAKMASHHFRNKSEMASSPIRAERHHITQKPSMSLNLPAGHGVALRMPAWRDFIVAEGKHRLATAAWREIRGGERSCWRGKPGENR